MLHRSNFAKKSPLSQWSVGGEETPGPETEAPVFLEMKTRQAARLRLLRPARLVYFKVKYIRMRGVAGQENSGFALEANPTVGVGAPVPGSIREWHLCPARTISKWFLVPGAPTSPSLRPEPAPLPRPCHHKPTGSPGGAGFGRQLPPQLSAFRLSVPAGSSGATREDFSQICYKNLIFVVAGQGEFSLFPGGIAGGALPALLAPRSRGTPSLHFSPTRFLLPRGESSEPPGTPGPQHLHRCCPSLLPLGKTPPGQPWGGQSPPQPFSAQLRSTSQQSRSK